MQFFPLLGLPLLALAAPTNLRARAGAPSKDPLPSDCPIAYAYPASNSTNFAPTDAFNSANILYQYSLSPGSTSPDGTDDSTAVNDCRETCYAWGNPGECKSIWTAHGSHVNEYGSNIYAEFVCRLYGAAVTSQDLGPQVPGDEDAQAHAEMIGCTRSQ